MKTRIYAAPAVKGLTHFITNITQMTLKGNDDHNK